MSYTAKFNKTLSALALGCSAALFAPAALLVTPLAAHAAPASQLPDFAELVEKTGPAVVNIRTTEKARVQQGFPGFDDDDAQEFFRRFFGIPLPRQQQPGPNQRRRNQPQAEEEVPRGVGSGFIISADGYVLTNAHVIDGADEVYVKLTDKREFKAKVVGLDKRTDVAVVKIEGNNLPRLTIGDSNKIRVGEWVIAIGSPFDLDNTVTAGIISAKARDTGDYLPLIQTDVAVNPGNSGGPLINMRGEVIGINSQIYSRSGGYMGISFAVPIDEAMRVVDQLKSTGKVSRGRLGVQISDVTKEVAESLNLPKAHGAQVRRVEPNTPADKAGLKAGDIILKFNGAAIEKSSDLPRLVGNTKPGTKSTLSVWRGGAARDITLVLTEMESDKVNKRDSGKNKGEHAANALGLVVSDLSEAQKSELKVNGGVVVDGVDGPAARADLRPGDVILQVNNAEIRDAKQFNALVAKLDTKRAAAVLVLRGGSSQFVSIKPQAAQ
ncbi:DegQ family serine endoprotease [Massilia sp. W12]|uniref:DegQ family serine endoprotease n=1 Tax=Massilia sp. W12 TaxID=3126507 RepID=UPI0030CA81F5